MDLIERQEAAIDALDVLCEEHRYKIPGKMETYSQYNEAWQDALDRAEGAIFNLPSAQRWIPCSERLPGVGKDVMVCYDFKGHRSVLIGVLYSDEKFHGYDDEYLTPEGRKYRKAVAWMPLPEPYRERRPDDE